MINWIFKKWAGHIMKRKPDVVIGKNYLNRWHVIPRNRWFNIYLHEFEGSDGRIFHDHPWWSLSYLVCGYLGEYSLNVKTLIYPGTWKLRSATYLHRLRRPPGNTNPITFFFTGPIIRMWGFQCPNGWVPYKDATGKRNNVNDVIDC